MTVAVLEYLNVIKIEYVFNSVVKDDDLFAYDLQVFGLATDFIL